jgi:L-threonylcarbamoyladenylate synthase
MFTKIYSELSNHNLKSISEILNNGGLMIYPTETIWAIGCISTNPKSVDKIYKLKKRKKDAPFINIIDDFSKIDKYVDPIDEELFNLIKENKSDHTIIYPNCKKLYYYLANNNNEIAFRVTPLSNLKEIMEMIDKPLISTSANISGEPFAKSFDKISSDLLNSVDVILNFEVESTGNPSSIIKINNGQIEYLRR